MRPFLCLPALACAFFLCGAIPSSPSEPERFNPFLHRQIVVGHFENTGEGRYAFLADALASAFFSYARTLSTIALSDEERSFLASKSGEAQYADAFREAGSEIRYRLEPRVASEKGDERAFPLIISGSYRVEDPSETVRLAARAYNSMTGRVDADFSAQIPLLEALSAPERFLVPFFRELLRYKAFAVTFLAEPADAIIYIDGRLVGVGKAAGILLPSGTHRLSVRAKDFAEYTTLFDASSDGAVMPIRLRAIEKTGVLRIASVPEGAELYVDGRFAGLTPVEIRTSGEERSFILVKEGYRDMLLTSLDMPQDGGEIVPSLVPLSLIGDLSVRAERHRQRAGFTYGGGIGMLALAILFGTQKTLYEQKADLYEGKDPQRSRDSAASARTFGVLAAVSGAASAGLFTFSFVDMVRYFRLYGSGRSGTPR